MPQGASDVVTPLLLPNLHRSDHPSPPLSTVSLGMPIMCSCIGLYATLQCLPIPQLSSCNGLILPHWHCSNLNVPAGNLMSHLGSSRSLLSSSGGELWVPHVNTSTALRRAFSIVATPLWNTLPSEIRLLSTTNTPLFYKLLKYVVCRRAWAGSATE